MKANEAPEKIWINSPQDLPCSSVDSNSIEYIRKDVFIEKAWDWMEDNLLSSNQQDKARTYCEQFRNYMKGE